MNERPCVRSSDGASNILHLSPPHILQLPTLIKKKIFLTYKEIQIGAVAKSYMRKVLLLYEEMRKYLPIYEEAVIVIYYFATVPF